MYWYTRDTLLIRRSISGLGLGNPEAAGEDKVGAWTTNMRYFKCKLSDWTNTIAFMASLFCLLGTDSTSCFHTNEFHHAGLMKEYSPRISLVYKTQVDLINVHSKLSLPPKNPMLCVTVISQFSILMQYLTCYCRSTLPLSQNYHQYRSVEACKPVLIQSSKKTPFISFWIIL